MLKLGSVLPDFSLPDPVGNHISIRKFDGASAYVVLFICNHCPYVKLLRKELVRFARDYQPREVVVLAINSNDYEAYPEDSPENMVREIETHQYCFPYLVDRDQTVAKAFHAACTPDIYVFDRDRELTYRGQFDESRPGNGVAPTGVDLRTAVDATLDKEPIPEDVQKPSIGCNIKWKQGNSPHYFTV